VNINLPGQIITGTTTATAVVSVNDTDFVSVNFSAPPVTFGTLSIDILGTGGGTVTPNTTDPPCTVGNCIVSAPQGSQVTLNALANAGSVFSAWGGACTGTVPCVVTIGAVTTTVSATFDTAPTFSISGTVTDSSTTLGLVGVALNLSNGFNTTTDGAGNYSLTNIPAGTFTLSANKAGFTLSADQSVTVGPDLTGKNFTATPVTAPTFIISGNVQGVSVITPVTLSNAGGLVETVNTDTFGAYVFSPVIDATYTVTPDTVTVKTAPPARSVTVAGANVLGVNFGASFSVSGTVNYPVGTRTGRLYISVNFPGQSRGSGHGTSVDFSTGTTGPVSYTIQGVPSGTYDIVTYLDHFATGVRNASNPVVASTNVNVNADQTGVNFVLADPISVTPAIPLGVGGVGLDQSAVFGWDLAQNASFIETAESYNVHYIAGATVTLTTVGRTTVNVSAEADGTLVVYGLTNNTQYAFIVTSVVGVVESAPSAVALITPNPPVVNPALSTVSGTITFPAVTAGTATLIVSLIDDANDASFFTGVLIAGTTSQAYTIPNVPNGTYELEVLVDVNNNGILNDAGDFTGGFGPGTESIFVTVSGANLSGQNLTISGANAFVGVSTRHEKNIAGTFEQHGLTLRGQQASKLPVKTVITGPNIPDTDVIQTEFDFQARLPYDLPVPSVGDTYTFTTTYLGVTLPETLTASVTAVLNSFAQAPFAPDGITTTTLTPTFSWNAPAVPPAQFGYRISVQDHFFVTSGLAIARSPARKLRFSLTQTSMPLRAA
jgi:hypothetical protein